MKKGLWAIGIVAILLCGESVYANIQQHVNPVETRTNTSTTVNTQQHHTLTHETYYRDDTHVPCDGSNCDREGCYMHENYQSNNNHHANTNSSNRGHHSHRSHH